jgi:hypothetical protein
MRCCCMSVLTGAIANTQYPARLGQIIPDWGLVEDDGIEPTTPCLQSRCSPS